MKNYEEIINKIYHTLFKCFGPQSWWPAETDFEILVGTILTQQSSWSNVEIAIQKLKNAGLLNHKKLAKANVNKIRKLISNISFFNIKASRIKNIAKKYWEIKKLYKLPIDNARLKLMNIKGIGPETCDSILLYAGNRKTFVIDGYTKRIVRRLGIFDEVREERSTRYNYEKLKNFFEKNMPEDIQIYNEFHALIVKLGKDYCKAKPLCINCPLKKICKKSMINNM